MVRVSCAKRERHHRLSIRINFAAKGASSGGVPTVGLHLPCPAGFKLRPFRSAPHPDQLAPPQPLGLQMFAAVMRAKSFCMANYDRMEVTSYLLIGGPSANVFPQAFHISTVSLTGRWLYQGSPPLKAAKPE